MYWYQSQTVQNRGGNSREVELYMKRLCHHKALVLPLFTTRWFWEAERRDLAGTYGITRSCRYCIFIKLWLVWHNNYELCVSLYFDQDGTEGIFIRWTNVTSHGRSYDGQPKEISGQVLEMGRRIDGDRAGGLWGAGGCDEFTIDGLPDNRRKTIPATSCGGSPKETVLCPIR